MLDTLPIVKLADVQYYSFEYVECDLLFDLAPDFCRKATSSRKLIKGKKIGKSMYVFAKKNSIGEWFKSDGKSKRDDKVLLNYDYLVNVPELWEKSDSSESDSSCSCSDCGTDYNFGMYNASDDPEGAYEHKYYEGISPDDVLNDAQITALESLLKHHDAVCNIPYVSVSEYIRTKRDSIERLLVNNYSRGLPDYERNKGEEYLTMKYTIDKLKKENANLKEDIEKVLNAYEVMLRMVQVHMSD